MPHFIYIKKRDVASDYGLEPNLAYRVAEQYDDSVFVESGDDGDGEPETTEVFRNDAIGINIARCPHVSWPWCVCVMKRLKKLGIGLAKIEATIDIPNDSPADACDCDVCRRHTS